MLSQHPAGSLSDEREAAIGLIMAALEDDNAKVPTSATCTHPAATVRVEHAPYTPPAYRTQYKTANAASILPSGSLSCASPLPYHVHSH